MGELVPIIVLIFIAIVIVTCFFLRTKQVVKPASEVEMVERDKFALTVEEAGKLAKGIEAIIASGKNGKYDLLMPDKILTIEVVKAK